MLMSYAIIRKRSQRFCISFKMNSAENRARRAARIVAYLKKAYPKPKSELTYKTPFQFVVAVVLSAQCTDKAVNRLTERLFKKYKTAFDFAEAKPAAFEEELSSVTFFKSRWL